MVLYWPVSWRFCALWPLSVLALCLASIINHLLRSLLELVRPTTIERETGEPSWMKPGLSTEEVGHRGARIPGRCPTGNTLSSFEVVLSIFFLPGE
jgi:hypothetical protein